ncbi:penicillin-binding protein activator [Sphingomonas solaris]|uniref:ABC transporter substrate-binding protein n=1 Tax=Alterirhizorhabdus solaris TaxID=2529389 RepID=A0A558RCM9_9SPHN|nr:penicillin-binding protein activator [Sphingomonas solaris]TVV77235.1 ABC transporter substrate-binding protein [Sphingomonas solaris]
MAEGSPFPQPRRFLRAGAVVAALLLGACQTMVPKSGPPKAVPPPIADRPADTGALPQDEARNRVALLVPMTGPNAAVGQSIANAANLALLDTGGARVRVTTYDTGPGAAAAAARALADGNRLILGPLLADEVRATAAAARPAGVPVIAFSNDAAVAGNGTFLMGFSPAQSVDRVVRYARSRGMTRFAGLMPTGAYGRNASNVLLRTAEAAGGSVVSMQTYDRTPASLAAAVGRIGQTRAAGQPYEAVLIADGGRIATQAAPLLRRQGATQLLGTELWNAEGALANNPAMQGAWFASVPDAMYRQLGTKYRARFGKAPYRLASLGYDAVLLTVRIAADWKTGAPFPAKALTDKGGFSGVDGAFRFRADGIAERSLAVHQIGPGGATVIAPAPRGFGG